MTGYDTYLALKARLGLPAPTSTALSADAVAAWEAQVGLTLPDDLRAFVLTYGDGAAGFAVQNGRGITRAFNRLLDTSEAALASAARPCRVGASGWLPRMPAYGPVMDLGFLSLKVTKAMVSDLDADTITDGMLALGETMDGSHWMIALGGKARGKVFVWSAEYDYEGLRPTKKTFGQLMELWLETSNTKLAKDVALLDDLEARGAAVWAERKPEEVMAGLRQLLRTAPADRLTRYLELGLGCTTLGPLDGWPNGTTQELIWGLGSVLARGETGVLVAQLARVLALPVASQPASRQLLSDFVTMTLLADAADGALELDYRAAYPRVEGVRGVEVRRIGEVCATAFKALPEAQQALVLQQVSPPAMLSMAIGGMTGHVDDVIARHPEAMRALALELVRDLAAMPTSLAGAQALSELSRALMWQLQKVPQAAPRLIPWLPLLAHGASVLQTPDGAYSAEGVGRVLAARIDTICATTGAPRDDASWRRTFDAELRG